MCGFCWGSWYFLTIDNVVHIRCGVDIILYYGGAGQTAETLAGEFAK